MSAAPAVGGEGSASAGPTSSPPPLHPAAPMHRRRTRTTQPQQQQEQQRTRTTTRGSQRAAPLPGYLAPTAAATARRREASAEDMTAHTAAPRTSTSKAARDGAPTSSPPATTATVDSSSFIEAVSDAQLHPTREALVPAADCAVPDALKKAPMSTPAVVDMGENEKNEHDPGRGVPSSQKPLSYPQGVGDEVADALALQEEMHTQFNALHTSLRLQPPPTPTAASERVEAALADVLGRTGDDGALTEALLEPRRTLRTSAQAALAAERAGLLHDSADSTQDEDVGGQRGKGIWSPTSATRRRSAATCAVVAAMTPAAVAEFLKTEAEAEAAAAEKEARENEQQQQQHANANATQTKTPTVGADAGSLPRQRHALATSSAMAESTAVLRELEVMQQRLHQHGYRHHAAPSPPPQQQQQQQQQPSEVSQPKGYGSSPCDISGSSTASSTSSQPSLERTGGHRHKRSVLRDWAAASVGEVVDALDRASLESRAARIKKRRSRSPRRRHGKSRDFDPEVFVRSLLDGQSRDGDEAGDADPDALFLFSGESADPLICARLLSPSSPPADLTDGIPRVSSLSSSMRAAALRRGGPSWTVTAAFDVGVTPSEVRELLRYSVSAPAAASWLSRETSRKQGYKPVEQLHAEVKSDQRGCDIMETREDGVVRAESRSEKRRRRSSATPSYALDAATQTALVHRIVSALPTVPPALTAEMARQRKLLERVCRDVAVAAMPVHEVLRERATSPTIASTLARQPPPINLTTPADGAAGSKTKDAATVEREAYEALVAAALPRPAVKALTAVAGLRSTAADPSRPLPAYHTVVARPALGPSSPQQPALMPSSAPQPYEAALHDMAEREARHYVGELDRLRTHYDRQLATERQERRSEQRQYAALLHGQQERMLRHHRETVHLLQRESRLQQQQQEALVEQLAAKQAAAAQRQQTEQARVTRQMLSGAVEAMRSHCVSPLDMDTHAGLGRGGKKEGASRGAAAKMERVQRIHARTSAAAAAPASTTAPAAKEVSDVVDKRATATIATAPPSLKSQQQQQREVRRLRVQIQEPDEDAVKAEEEESFSRSPAAATAPFDADVPTLGHLTPLQQQLDTTVPPAEDAVPTLPKSSGAAEKDGSEVEVSPVRERRLVHHRRHAPQSSNAVTATDAHTTTDKNTDARRSAPPPAAKTPALQLNTSEALRSVYGGPRSGRDAQQTTTYPLQRSTSPPPPTRMTLPLHAHLPPEDELDRHLRRVAAATVVVDARAAAAAEAAGLASGTKLYAAVAAAPSQRKARVTAASSAKTPTRLLSAPPAVRRAAAPSAVVAGRTSPAQQPRRSQTQPRRVGQGGSRLHPRRRPDARTAQSPGSKFDVEVVSLLSGLTGEDSQRGSDVHHVHNTWHQSRYHHSSAAPHGVSHAGMGTDRTMDETHFTTAEEPQHHPPRLDAGLTAGRPSVGPTLLLLSDPPAMPAQHGAPPSTASATATARPEAAMPPPWLARASPAAALTQVVNADLQQAQHERERRVAELRDAAERQATHQRISAETVAGGDETALRVTVGPPQPVGALPPCDAAFFGAPDEVVQPSENTDGSFNGAAHTGSATDAVDSHRGRHSCPDDFDSLLLAHPVAAHQRGSTDYARAWGRYEAAAAEVEAAAGALAAEDAGVLATVARVHHGRENSTARQQQQEPLTHTTVPLLVPASAAAGVRYREQQLHALPGEKDAIEGGGAFVSPKMAEEARALTAARQRLAQIRDCFITPPTSMGAAAAPAAAMTPASVVGPHADAAVVRRMVDETVFSLLEEEGMRQRDPVRRVVSAIEHELLRLLLQEQLTETPSPAAAAAASFTRHTGASLKELEPSLVTAMVEAALEDAVRATISQRRAEGEDGATAAAQQQPSKPERNRLALARALQQLADGGDTTTTSANAHPLVDDVVRERVAVPVVPSNAWLHDTAEAGDTVPAANDAAAALTARTQTASPPPASTASTAPGNAPVALVEAAHAQSAGEAAAVRVVLDLSPAVRQFFSRYDPTSAAARPPMQHEQLPSRWMAQEDRRDVIVETELRPTRALLPPPHDVEVEEADEVSAAPQSGTAEEGEERTTQPVPLEKAAVDDMNGEVPIPTPPPPLLLPPPPPPPPPASVSASGGVQSLSPAATPVPTGVAVPTPWATTPAASVTNDFDAPLPVSAPLHAVQNASQSSAPPTAPPPPTLNYVPFMLSVLTTQLIDNEELQRGSLADREEEQRESLWRLRAVVHAKANRRGSRPATPPLRAPTPTSTTGAEQPAAALPSAPTLAPVQEHLQPATTTATAPRLPPVRDPVMNAVLEYVYQFGCAQRSPTRAAPNLVEELQAAAAVAAAAAPQTPAAGESGGWLDGWEVGGASAPAVQFGADPASQRVARAAVGSQASTRNLGSSTSTASLPSEPSLPSSLRTDTSSSSLADTRWAAGVLPLAEAHHLHHRRTSAARPVVDVQRLDAAYRRGATPAKKRAAAASSGSGGSDTTRYTTTDSASDGPPQPSSRHEGANEEGKGAADALSSAVLPQRVSMEVQAALEAALRSHRLAAAEPTSTSPEETMETSAAWPESSRYAVTLPARSADTTRGPDAALPAEKRTRPLRRRSPISPHPRKDVHRPREQKESDGGGVAVAALHAPPQRRHTAPPPVSTQWEGYSLTSTSTSSHGGTVNAARQPSAALTSSALPFLS